MILLNFIIFEILIISLIIASYILNRLLNKNKSIINIHIFTIPVIVISIIASYYTSFKSIYTVLIVILIVGLILFTKELRNTKNLFTPINKKQTIILIIISFIFFIYHNYGSYLLADHIYYAKLSKSIIQYGQEHPLTLYKTLVNENGIFLYHYYDLWLNGFLCKIFNLQSTFTLVNVIYPFFSYLTFISVFLIIYKGENFLKNLIISICITFGSLIVFTQILNINDGHNTFWGYGFPHVTSYKTLCAYPYIILSLYFLTKKRFSFFILFSSISIFIYLTILPSFFVPINLVLILYILIYKNKRLRFLKYIVFFNLSIVSLFVFYSILNKESSGLNNSKIIDIVHPINFYLKNITHYFYKSSKLFYIIVLLYPIGFVISIVNSKKLIINNLFVYSSIFTSIAIVVLFENVNNSIQYFTTIISPLMLFQVLTFTHLKNKLGTIITIIFIITVSILNINSLYYGKNTNYFRNNRFDSRIAKFGEIYIKENNWAYYSVTPYSNWTYNTNIVKCALLQNENCKIGIELSPIFQKDFNKYLLKNSSYPFKKIKNQSIILLNKELKKYDIKYIYIENIDSVNNNFRKNLIPCIINNKKGIWKI